jgi:hypothetical protein
VPKESKFKLPRSPAQCADLLYQTREQRLKVQKEVDRLQAQETALKEFFIATLPKSQATGIAGRLARVQTSTHTVPVVEDWEAFYKFVRKEKNGFVFLQRRLSEAPVLERWEAKKQVPGIGRFNAVKVSCTLLK